MARDKNKREEKQRIIRQEFSNEKENRLFQVSLNASLRTIANTTSNNAHPSSSHPSHSILECGLTASQLADLQNRELTPEDYELLLALDTSVPKKTLSLSKIDEIAPKKSVSSDILDLELNCVICFSEFEENCNVRTLPCGHIFHADCIENWLGNSSVNCPVDNLPLIS